MKKILFPMLVCAALMLNTSCKNNDIDIDIENDINVVNISVSLSNLYSAYNFNDTKHGIKISDEYRTFNADYGKYIQVRTYIYDNNSGALKDSVVSFQTNTNAVNQTVRLAAGDYTVVSMLSFTDSDYDPYWIMKDRNNLSTAAIMCDYRFNKWALMSFASKTITVTEGIGNNVSMSPSPIGALTYLYCQNFQYEDETTYGTLADNGIRELAVYAKTVAIGYKLNPAIMGEDKYVYLNDPGSDNWYYLSSQLEPSDFEDSWTFFKTNLYSYFYILAPQSDICFGYMSEGASGFAEKGTQYGKNFQNGQMYLAYWDWFAAGNPYFDIADNNHWNTYSSVAAKATATAKAARGRLFEE